MNFDEIQFLTLNFLYQKNYESSTLGRFSLNDILNELCIERQKLMPEFVYLKDKGFLNNESIDDAGFPICIHISSDGQKKVREITDYVIDKAPDGLDSQPQVRDAMQKLRGEEVPVNTKKLLEIMERKNFQGLKKFFLKVVRQFL